MKDKKNILGVGITDATKKEILEYIVKSLENFKKKYYIVTPNPELLVISNKKSDYKDILNNAELALPDGVGVLIAGKILGRSLKGRFTGIGLLESLSKECEEKPITVGFLGGRGNVAERTAECLKLKYPKLKIAFIAEEYSIDGFGNARDFELRIMNYESRNKSQELSKRNDKANIYPSSFILHNSVDILFVAYGSPKQEIWIKENLDKIPVKIAIGVGGSFDYVSGKIGRAPLWMQNIGLEWFYRLIRQPWRIKRQLSLLEFIWLVCKEKLTQR